MLLFGALADAAGWRACDVSPAPATLEALRARLTTENNALGAALAGRGVQAAVDRTLVRGDAPLTPGCEVAFMPPMSGG